MAVACFLILATAAARKTTRVRQGWEQRLGSHDEILKRVPGIEISSACPREHWVYEVSPEGAMTLALNREVTWPDLKGARLPTHVLRRHLDLRSRAPLHR